MQQTKPAKRPRKKRLWTILLITVGILVLVRLILPYVVKHYVNKKLSELESYYGSVQDIDLAIYRGAYVIHEFDLHKKLQDKNEVLDTIPFLNINEIDLSVEWSALFKGRIVGEIILHEARLNFVKDIVEQRDIEKDTTDFRTLIEALMPLKVNRFKVTDSEIHYLDPFSYPRVDVFMHEVQVLASNLSNVRHKKELLPSTVVAHANLYGGRFDFEMQLDALARTPTFDMNAELSALDITSFNNFFKAYGNFDAESGTVSMYTEMAARNGKTGGYVKPLLIDLDILNWKEDDERPIQLLWEATVGAGAEIFSNQPHDQVGTKIEIEGELANPDMNLLNLIGYTLRNAFLRALRPSIEESINIYKMENSRGTLLERIFKRE